jgi:hypothetical protein
MFAHLLEDPYAGPIPPSEPVTECSGRLPGSNPCRGHASDGVIFWMTNAGFRQPIG